MPCNRPANHDEADVFRYSEGFFCRADEAFMSLWRSQLGNQGHKDLTGSKAQLPTKRSAASLGLGFVHVPGIVMNEPNSFSKFGVLGMYPRPRISGRNNDGIDGCLQR